MATGAGPPVVLIHGLGLDHRMWERQVPALAAAGHRVITCDLPGHGAGGRPTRAGSAYTTEELAASLVEALEESGVEPATLVGFSLGGGIALQVALDRPARVTALALVDTTAWPGPDAVARFAGRAAAVEAEGVGVLVQPAIERWFTREFVTAQGEIVRRYAGSGRTTRSATRPPAAPSPCSTSGLGSARSAAPRWSWSATATRPRPSQWRKLWPPALPAPRSGF